jgi:hypothetical protein
MKAFFLSLGIIFLSSSIQAYSQYTSSSFYIIAHQDDWQLFMGKDAWDDMIKPERKVVFIYLTAGDACNKTGNCAYQIPYFVSREEGAKNSVYLVTDHAASPPSGFNRNANNPITINNHILMKWQYKNVVKYFLRLPDGRLHFNESSRSSCGFDPHDSTYINLFRRGILPKLSDINGTTTYNSWSDLVTTIKRILHAEGKFPVSIHAPEFIHSLNTHTHPDHRETGLIVDNLVNQLHGADVSYYLDYHSRTFPINLDEREIMRETGLFAAYNMGKINNGCPTDWNEYDLEWCQRNIISRFFHVSRPFDPSTASSGLVMEITPNPVSRATTVSIIVPYDDSILCSVFDIQGKLIENLIPLQRFLPGTYKYEIGNLPQGVYILKLVTQSGYTLTEKIFIN